MKSTKLIGLFLLIVITTTATNLRSEQKTKTSIVVSPWLVFNAEQEGIAMLRPYVDVVDSVSIFAKATPEFIKFANDNNVEVYQAVGGDENSVATAEARQSTIERFMKYIDEDGCDGIDLDLEHLNTDIREEYSIFMRELSKQLHARGKKLAMCVGFYPPMVEKDFHFWYDPKTIAENCDQVRIMGYDMYHAPGKNKYAFDRWDCQAVGPNCTQPWSRDAINFWLRYVTKEKLILGMPAYSNDYVMSVDGGGEQVYASVPNAAKGTKVDKYWMWYEKIHAYRYLDEVGKLHLFYAADARSTDALFDVVEETGISGVAMWHMSEVTQDIWEVVRERAKE
jgi:spore germination protein YaaH